MEYQLAQNLGMVAQQVGIAANARVFIEANTDGPLGMYIWDLKTEETYVMVNGGNNNPIRMGHREVPQHVKDIIRAPDDDLKNRWLSTEGWDEVRATVYSELVFRGINILEMERNSRNR